MSDTQSHEPSGPDHDDHDDDDHEEELEEVEEAVGNDPSGHSAYVLDEHDSQGAED